MRAARQSDNAFTLVETMIGLVIILLVGGIVYTLFNLGMTLYAQNVSLGQTHSGGLDATERLYLKIAGADETPLLTDDAGAVVAGNGPSAGVRLYNLGSPLTYQVAGAVSATAYSMNVTQTGLQPQPRTGDKIVMDDLGFQGVITAVSTASGTHTLSFGSTIGNGFVPTKFSGTAIPNGAKCFLLQPSAFIAVGNVLRHYPRAMSVAQDGPTAFNNPANFVAISSLLPLPNETNAFPFQYLGTSRRSINVNLRLRSPAYGGKVGNFYAYQSLKTTVAYRSSVTR